MKHCPECGKALVSETSKFCDNCGAKFSNVNTPQQKEIVQPVVEEKNSFLAALCSFFIPGFGQVYNGQMAKGLAIFIGAVIGFFIYIIPGVLVWLFGIYDAYTSADKMNKKEIPFQPTNIAHLIIFIILVIIIVVIVCAVIFLVALVSIFGPHAH